MYIYNLCAHEVQMQTYEIVYPLPYELLNLQVGKCMASSTLLSICNCRQCNWG